MTPLRPFLRGENVDLVVPTPEHVASSTWPDWFNSQHTSRYLVHGVFSNSREDQQSFLAGLKGSNRFALLITPAGQPDPIGVVSLSGIDFRQGTAAIAIVMDQESEFSTSPLASLEAMALMTTHAFEVMGLRRIEAGQVYPALQRWARMLELLGYRAEGIKRQAFQRGHQISDVVVLGCIYEDYLRIRDGRTAFWPGNVEARRLIATLPRRSHAEAVEAALRAVSADYFGD